MLLSAGYWPTTYFQSSYWNSRYWQTAGGGSSGVRRLRQHYLEDDVFVNDDDEVFSIIKKIIGYL
jgi:hypothetical protein